MFVRLAAGATVQRIAQDLKLSSSTVGTHLYNIKQKLGVTNQSGAAVRITTSTAPSPGASSYRPVPTNCWSHTDRNSTAWSLSW